MVSDLGELAGGCRDRGWEGVTRVWSPSRMVSWPPDHERTGAGRVSRGSGPCSPTVSDHEQRVEGVTVPWSASGCRAIRARGLPWSPVISDRGWEGLGRLGPWSPTVSRHEHNGAGRVSRGGPIMGPAGVTRPGSVIFMVSDHERQGLEGCHSLGSCFLLVRS